MIPHQFPIARYKLQFEVTEKIELPTYAGSTLRGAFGQTLRKISGMKSFEDNKGDLSPYAQIFAPSIPEHNHSQKFSQVPSAYIIEPPQWGARDYNVGEILSFDIVLFGNLLDKLAIIIFAFQQAFQHKVAQGKAHLIDVYQQDNQLQWQDIWRNGILKPISNKVIIPKTLSPNLNIQLQTPLRLQKNGEPLKVNTITVTRFLLTLAKRISLLSEFYQEPLNLDFEQLKQEITEVKDLKFLQWQDWYRYSSRQKQKMPLGGVIGEWQFSHLSENWQKLIYLGQWLHCGKNASFGLGKYQIANL